MKNIKIPAFGETDFFENRENEHAVVFMIPNADADVFSAYGKLLSEQGYTQKEASETDTHLYAAFFNGEDAFFLNYFSAVRELYLVQEDSCPYFSYSDTPRNTAVTPQITQMELADFGMSYVIRLSDGRFIIIDGGRDFEVDRERLYQHLCANSVHERPIIAAWILSHPHADHFHLFVGFVDQYGEDVVIEKMLFLFPEADDLAHYPSLEKSDRRFDYDNSGTTYIRKLLERIERLGLPVYRPHTGQTYQIGDAACEILASMDDTIHASTNVNAASLVIRMELGGQTILWATDAPFSTVQLAEKQGERLKADILQIPHHGFQSGTAEGEISGYERIQPRVCFLPVSDYNAYTTFCAHREGTRYLMTQAGIDELITGTPMRTIELPYTPAPYAKAEILRSYLAGQDNCGSKTWVFTGLSTSEPDDFVFTLLNSTHIGATVWIELFFEDRGQWVRHIKADISPLAMRQISIVGDRVDPDALEFNWLSLHTQGIPENARFSVRFLCSLPMIVSHEHHPATYHSINR